MISIYNYCVNVRKISNRTTLQKDDNPRQSNPNNYDLVTTIPSDTILSYTNFAKITHNRQQHLNIL